MVRHVILGHTDTQRNKNALPGYCLSVSARKRGGHFLKTKQLAEELFFTPRPLVLTNVNDRNVMGQKELIIHLNYLVQHQCCICYKS